MNHGATKAAHIVRRASVPNWVLASIVAYLICIALWATPAVAQANGTLEGVVKDTTGAVLPGASITATQTATLLKRATTTNNIGYYRLPDLPVGTYQITASAKGFQTTILRDVQVRVDQVADVDIGMKVGEVEQQVTVEGAAPLVETSTTAVGGVVENREINALPLNGRHFLQLGLLVPGTSTPQAGSTQQQWGTQGGRIGFSVSGQRDSYNNFTLDGVNEMDTNYNTVTISPPVDDVQEFNIVADGYSAKFGILPGAQVDIVTRSGTNSLHGSAYEFLRNSALDAKNFFDAADRSIPPFRQNQFGGTVGGPIVKNRAFFFLGYEGLRVRQSLTQTTVVPTDAMKAGDLSGINPGTEQAFPQVFDPVTHAPFVNNQIPASMINPMAAAILALTPSPNVANALPGQSNFIGVGLHNQNEDSFLGRIDYQVSPNNLAFVRYSQQRDGQSFPFVSRFNPVLPGVPGFGDDLGAMGRNIAAGITSTINPNLVNVFRFGNNSLNAIVQSQHLHDNFLQSLGFARFGKTINTGLPLISIPGIAVLGDQDVLQPNIRQNNGFEFKDDVSYTHGRFTHEFGTSYWRYYLNGVTDTFSNGSFNFGDERLGFGQTVTGSGFSDFLLDRPRLSLVQLGVGFGSYRYNYLGTYYNTTFRATPSFTINLGLRYEFSTSPTPIDGTITSILDMQKGVIVLGSQSGALPSLNDPLTQYFIRTFGSQFATNRDVGLPASTNSTYYKNFAPRVGLAWDPSKAGKLVVRSSFGLFNNFQERGYAVQSGVLGPPFAPTIANFQDSLFEPNLPPLTYENTYATGGPPTRPPDNGGPSTAGIPPGVRPGYLEEWTFSVQSQVAKNTAAEADYVGSHGVHINGFILNDQNFPNTLTARGGFPPDPRYGESFQEHSDGMSWYQGLSLKLTQRYSHGINFTAGYTFAKSEDTVSTFTGGPTDSPVPQNSYDLAGNKGLSNYDVRHRFVFSYVWDLPFGAGKPLLNHGGPLAAILADWQWGGVVSLEAGHPFTVQLTGNVSGIASSSADRPNCTGDPNADAPRTVDEWFNTGAFAKNTLVVPATGFPYRVLGTCGRNSVIGPPFRNYDTSLSRKIRMTERTNLEFRADFFNIFNHPNFDIPNRFFGSSTFGRIQSAQFPRQIQFGLHLSL